MKFKEVKLGDKFKVGDETYVKTEWTNKPNHAYNAHLDKFDGLTKHFHDNDEVIGLKPYKVACEWAKTHEITIYAEDLESAIDIVNEDDGTLINTDTDGDYLDDSFWVNEEVTMELNKEES